MKRWVEFELEGGLLLKVDERLIVGIESCSKNCGKLVILQYGHGFSRGVKGTPEEVKAKIDAASSGPVGCRPPAPAPARGDDEE